MGGGNAGQVLDEDPQASTRGGGSAEQGLREELHYLIGGLQR
jgi:hypothetical protein